MERRKILIVEKESSEAADLGAMVESLGYQAITFSSPAEALRKAEEVEPDLALIDLRTACSMDALATVHETWANQGFPVVYMAGRPALAAMNGAVDLIYRGCLIKPFTQDELAAAIVVGLDRARKSGGDSQSE